MLRLRLRSLYCIEALGHKDRSDIWKALRVKGGGVVYRAAGKWIVERHSKVMRRVE